jgi:hypothetical protein
MSSVNDTVNTNDEETAIVSKKDAMHHWTVVASIFRSLSENLEICMLLFIA